MMGAPGVILTSRCEHVLKVSYLSATSSELAATQNQLETAHRDNLNNPMDSYGYQKGE